MEQSVREAHNTTNDADGAHNPRSTTHLRFVHDEFSGPRVGMPQAVAAHRADIGIDLFKPVPGFGLLELCREPGPQAKGRRIRRPTLNAAAVARNLTMLNKVFVRRVASVNRRNDVNTHGRVKPVNSDHLG